MCNFKWTIYLGLSLLIIFSCNSQTSLDIMVEERMTRNDTGEALFISWNSLSSACMYLVEVLHSEVDVSEAAIRPNLIYSELSEDNWVIFDITDLLYEKHQFIELLPDDPESGGEAIHPPILQQGDLIVVQISAYSDSDAFEIGHPDFLICKDRLPINF